MLLDLLREFVLELVRALFLEGVCRRVKERISYSLIRRRSRRRQAFYRWLRSRHSQRLVHKITTEASEEL